MVGKRLLHYKITEKLGEGGMGIVYKARDTHLDRFVAIKVLPNERMADPSRKARFVQEAKSASALNHPSIVTIYDISSDAGQDFIAMEYVAGWTLDQIIPRRGMRVSEALKIAVQIADALARAHSVGIVHRDVKPANLMVNEHGLVKVLDFGLAKLTEQPVSDDASTATMGVQTEEGAIAGTAAYMSPEQVEGRKLDARSDIFSFGAVLYEMVSGKRAFRGDSKLSTLAAVLQKEPEPLPSECPAELARVVTRCLRKNAERRFQHIDDVKIALEELKEESISRSGAARVPVPVRRRYRWMYVAGATCGLTLAMAVWFVISGIRSGSAIPLVRPLTSYQGFESEASFSPDGRQVAFAWNGEKQNNYDIYVKLIDSEPPLRLTSNPARDASPAWSPDGRQIAFLRDAPGGAQLWVVSALGGAERRLAQVDGRSGVPAWSPDGKFLAVMDQSAISFVSYPGGQKRRFTSPPVGSWGDTAPAFSPDGKTVAFVRSHTHPSGDIFTAPITDGTTVTRVTNENRSIAGLAWDKDGLVFSSNREGDALLYRISPSGGTTQRLAFSVPDALHPAVVLRGRRAAFTRYTSNYTIWRVDLGTHAPRGPTRLIASTRRDQSPRISPDGRRIAFTSNRSGSPEIWICDSNGANALRLTSFAGGHVGPPDWSPDGSRIVFSARPTGNADIFVIDAGGGEPQRLTSEPSDENNPSWSKDGRWIYFGANRTGRRQIWRMPAGGGNATQFTKAGGFSGVESSDGRYFYYVVTESGMNGILRRVPVDGGEETVVMPGARLWGDWTLSNNGIYFVDQSGRKALLRFFDFTKRRIEDIAALEQPGGFSLVRLSLSPDERWMLLDLFEHSESDLMLVENYR